MLLQVVTDGWLLLYLKYMCNYNGGQNVQTYVRAYTFRLGTLLYCTRTAIHDMASYNLIIICAYTQCYMYMMAWEESSLKVDSGTCMNSLDHLRACGRR